MCDILLSLKEQIDTENSLSAEKCDNDVPDFMESLLLNMPVEILLNICSFLDPDFLKLTMSRVCKRFQDILADDHLWKYWIHSRINGSYPIIQNLEVNEADEFEWQDVCVDMFVENRKWTNVTNTMHHTVVKDVHYASVDTVLLVNNGEFCLSGSRDRGMALWSIEDVKAEVCRVGPTGQSEVKPRHMRHDAHAGWLWDLAPDDPSNATVVYSASWDNTVKAWDLVTGLTCLETFTCGMSALSVITNTTDKIVMAGLCLKNILSFDLRCGPKHISSYKAHKGPVLALQQRDEKVASISEDKTLAIWDRRAGKLLVKDLKLPMENGFPICISWCSYGMYIGDSRGSLHLLHPEKFYNVKSTIIWPEPEEIHHPNKIIGCHQSLGSMIVASDRGEFKFFYNCDPPHEYTSIMSSSCDVTKLQYQNGVLVTGAYNAALEFWIPNEEAL